MILRASLGYDFYDVITDSLFYWNKFYYNLFAYVRDYTFRKLHDFVSQLFLFSLS